jgi:Spy/CpxP family protein refolding chaperone
VEETSNMNIMKFFAVTAVAVIAVSSFAQGGGGGRGGFGGGQGRGGFGGMQDATGVFLLNRDDVAGEIKLTTDQKSKLDAIRTAQREKMRDMFQGGGGGGDREAMMAAMQKLQAENAKETLAVLNDDQKKRLKELAVQRMGMGAAMNADIQKELGVTDDQKAKIKDLQDKQQAANQALMEKMRNQELDREGFQAAQQKNREIMNTELGKVLTADQKTKLTAMGGKPFKFVEQERGGGL